MSSDLFYVDEVEVISFDEKGHETEPWIGYAATNREDPANYSFQCQNKDEAERLCEFLNNECYININDTSIEAFVLDNCIEWSNLVSDLSNKQREVYYLKEDYKIKSDQILEEVRKHKEATDEDIIKVKYGGNNDKTRAKYVKETLAEDSKKIKELEFDIWYLEKRISYIKGLVYTKNSLLNAKTVGVEDG